MRGIEDGLILRVIKSAAVAGGCEYWARKEPDAVSGLKRCAAKHRADYEAALTEMIRGAARG